MDNIQNVLKNVINQMAIKQPDEHNKIERIWENILTVTELKHTKIEGFKDGKLLVIVDSPAWLYQMKQKKYTLLNRFKEEIQEIKYLIFKIGKVK